MNFDLTQPTRFLVGIIKFFGLWELGSRWEPLYRVYSFVLHSIFTIVHIGTLWASIFTAKTLEEFTESLYMSLAETGYIVKFVNIVYFRRESVEFFELVAEPVFELRGADEKTIFKTAHRTFDLLAKFYVSACAFVVANISAIVAFGSTNVLPYPAWMPFELNSETYWYAYSFQLVGLVVNCLCNVSIDMLQCYYLHHLSLIYRVIGYRLSKIGAGIEEGFPSQVDDNRKVIEQLKQIIEIHLFVKRLTAKCEGLTSFPFFMQVFLSALIICFTGYRLQEISPLERPLDFIGTADLLFVVGLQIYLPCYYANQVTIESGQLSEALYNSNWVVLPQKSRKLICLCMEFLRDPVDIRAGVFFNIGMPIFVKTINNAYSYFAILVKMKN